MKNIIKWEVYTLGRDGGHLHNNKDDHVFPWIRFLIGNAIQNFTQTQLNGTQQ